MEAPAQVPLGPSLVEIDQGISKLNVAKESVSKILLHLRNSLTYIFNDNKILFEPICDYLSIEWICLPLKSSNYYPSKFFNIKHAKICF